MGPKNDRSAGFAQRTRTVDTLVLQDERNRLVQRGGRPSGLVTGLAAVLIFAAATRVLGSVPYGVWSGSLAAGPIVLGAVIACSVAALEADSAEVLAAETVRTARADWAGSVRAASTLIEAGGFSKIVGPWRGVPAPPMA